MKVTREQAVRNREHVVEVAGLEFRRHGFSGIGVADLMQAAGLTAGGFYKNFSSKDALAAEAVSGVFAQSTARLRELAVSSAQPFEAAVRYYLSPQHRDSVATGCAIAALSQDAARGSPALRLAFEAGIRAYVDLLMEIGGLTPPRALSVYATMVGALGLSRTVVDPELSEHILTSAVDAVLAEDSTVAPCQVRL